MLHFKIVVLSSIKYFSHSDFKNSEFFVKEDELKSTSGDELNNTRTLTVNIIMGLKCLRSSSLLLLVWEE